MPRPLTKETTMEKGKPTEIRCKDCRWVHESDGHDSFMGVGLCSLHAAAPELLEACKTMMEAMAYLQEHDKLPDDTCPADLYTLAYEVIAKATGRAQG